MKKTMRKYEGNGFWAKGGENFHINNKKNSNLTDFLFWRRNFNKNKKKTVKKFFSKKNQIFVQKKTVKFF